MANSGIALSKLGLKGLQRRIMLYVAAGLVIMFVAWGYISARGVNTISDLLLEERVTAVESVAAIIALDLNHVAIDVDEALESFPGIESESARHDLLEDSINHLRFSDEFIFFRPAEIIVASLDGEELARVAAAGESTGLPASTLAAAIGNPSEVQISPSGAFPETSSAFAIVAVPLDNATAYVINNGILSPDPIPSFLPGMRDADVDAPDKYKLEVLDSQGRIALNIGSEKSVGDVSRHWPMVRNLVTGGRGGADVDQGGEDDTGAHLVAAAPISDTGLYLALEQTADQAISVPSDIRFQFIMIGVLGFVAALLVAWFTTRRVVRPTLELAAAAERMAAGDLDSPVEIDAQDEIAGLTANVELMRERLANALSDLEGANRELGLRVRERTERLTEALRQVISAQEGERQRVARDLHDDVAQQLIVLSRGIKDLRTEIGGQSPEIPDHLDEIAELARMALATVRRVSRDLRPSVLDDLGLVSALSWIANEAQERSSLEISVEAEADSAKIGPEVALAAFRITQEAVHNIERHANAKHVRIGLAQSNGALAVAVEDDGQGFEVPEPLDSLARRGYIGLLGMSERAELIGGHLTISSKPGSGTRICATIPMNPLEPVAE